MEIRQATSASGKFNLNSGLWVMTKCGYWLAAGFQQWRLQLIEG
jgi:hypothetical protein